MTGDKFMDTYKDIINKIKPDLDKTLEYLRSEIGGLQVGRATPALVENIEVECYNSKMSLKQLAAIHVPEPRSLMIQPWDSNILKDIEKAISDSRRGLAPVVDGDLIRVKIPPLSEERRKELLSILIDRLEQTRIAVRLRRDEAWKEIQELTRQGKIREDDKFRGKDELQKLIDEYNEKIEEAGETKKKEITTI